MQKFGNYIFKTIQNADKTGWFYHIKSNDLTLLKESKDLFTNENTAKLAAIGHISLLEQGKG